MSLEPADDADVLEFLNVGLDQDFAALLAVRLVRENGANMLAVVADAWLYGATAARNALSGRRVCHVCGCWEMHACVDEHGQGCSWVGPNLCSACDLPPDAPPAEKAA